jgi:uncharacterized repeat protein (TIGR03803 family)
MNTKPTSRKKSWVQFEKRLAAWAGVLSVSLTAANNRGQTYTVLHSFTGSDGPYAQGDLVLSGTTLYGTTCNGGNSNCGTVFRVSTDGTGYMVLKHFSGTDRASPWVVVRKQTPQTSNQGAVKAISHQ